MSFCQPPALLSEPTAEESWALETMLEEEAKMIPCPLNLLPIYKVQVVDGSTRHPSIVEQEDFDVVTDFLETVMRQRHPELGPGLDAVHKEQMDQQLLLRSKVTQGLSEQPNKVKQDQQPGKKRKTAVEEKGKKAKIAVKKILKPQILSGEDIPAVAGKYGPSTQGQSGENQTDDILNKYKFLTVTKSATPLKLKSNDSVQRKGVPKIKAKVGAKKVKGSLKNISVAHRERGKDGVEEEKTDQAASLGSQADQVEAAAGREQMESTASSLVNYLKEESETSVDHIEKFSNEEENTVNTANILNKYKFLTDLLPAPRKDEEVEEVTMEETTAEDLLGKAEGRGGTGSDLVDSNVEATVKKGKEPSAKISKKSRATVVRKDIAKGKVPCGQCEKTFANSSSLKQHITIHTNEKPYLCKECPDKFRNSNMLSGHRKKVHPKSLPDKTDTVPPV